MGDNRDRRYKLCLCFGQLDALDTCAVLDLDGSVLGQLTLVLLVGWMNRFLIIEAGVRCSSLHMTERLVAHCVGAADLAVDGEAHTAEKVVIRLDIRHPLEVV